MTAQQMLRHDERHQQNRVRCPASPSVRPELRHCRGRTTESTTSSCWRAPPADRLPARHYPTPRGCFPEPPSTDSTVGDAPRLPHSTPPADRHAMDPGAGFLGLPRHAPVGARQRRPRSTTLSDGSCASRPRLRLLPRLISEPESTRGSQFILDPTVVFGESSQVMTVFCRDLVSNASNLIDFVVTHRKSPPCRQSSAGWPARELPAPTRN